MYYNVNIEHILRSIDSWGGSMKIEYQLEKKPSILLEEAEKIQLLTQYFPSSVMSENTINKYEFKKLPLFHMDFTNGNDGDQANKAFLIATDEKRVHPIPFVYGETRTGKITIKDQGESFVIVQTKKPALISGTKEIFEVVEIEYNPKAIW